MNVKGKNKKQIVVHIGCVKQATVSVGDFYLLFKI